MQTTGFFDDHRGRGFHSAEVRALAKEGLDRSEIRQVIDRTDRSVTVETTGGRLVTIGSVTAKNLGIVP
ncbi:MAG TPA: hypothetical protein VI794_01605 [Patescibacteria group bacterium]|nr:hypothetical protein [Patescibacteria group bacterium]